MGHGATCNLFLPPIPTSGIILVSRYSRSTVVSIYLLLAACCSSLGLGHRDIACYKRNNIMGATSPITQVADHLEVVTCTILMHLLRSQFPPSMHQTLPVMRPLYKGVPRLLPIYHSLFLLYTARVDRLPTTPVQTLFSPDSIQHLHQHHPFCMSVSFYHCCRVYSGLLIMTVLNFTFETTFSLGNPCAHETGHINFDLPAARSLPPQFEPYLTIHAADGKHVVVKQPFRL